MINYNLSTCSVYAACVHETKISDHVLSHVLHVALWQSTSASVKCLKEKVILSWENIKDSFLSYPQLYQNKSFQSKSFLVIISCGLFLVTYFTNQILQMMKTIHENMWLICDIVIWPFFRN